MELPNFLLAGLNQLGGGIVVGPLVKRLGEEVCKPAWPVSVAIGASLKDVKRLQNVFFTAEFPGAIGVLCAESFCLR